MTRHTHDDGVLVQQPVAYDYVEHYPDDQAGLLVVRDVPAEVCPVCDEFCFDEDTGFTLSRLIGTHRPDPGTVNMIDWVDHEAA
jgi:YgiT-type zinc finger domain-containing protein